MVDINVHIILLKYQSIQTKSEVLRIQLLVYKVMINPDSNSAKIMFPLFLLPAQHSFNCSEFLIDFIFRSSSTQLCIFLWEPTITADKTEAPKVYKATIVYRVLVKYCMA